MRAHRIEVVRWRCSGFTMLHPLRPPLIGLYPGHPHPLLASLSHGDFRDWENEKSYAMHIDTHTLAERSFPQGERLDRMAYDAPPRDRTKGGKYMHAKSMKVWGMLVAVLVLTPLFAF